MPVLAFLFLVSVSLFCPACGSTAKSPAPPQPAPTEPASQADSPPEAVADQPGATPESAVYVSELFYGMDRAGLTFWMRGLVASVAADAGVLTVTCYPDAPQCEEDGDIRVELGSLLIPDTVVVGAEIFFHGTVGTDLVIRDVDEIRGPRPSETRKP